MGCIGKIFFKLY